MAWHGMARHGEAGQGKAWGRTAKIGQGTGEGARMRTSQKWVEFPQFRDVVSVDFKPISD